MHRVAVPLLTAVVAALLTASTMALGSTTPSQPNAFGAPGQAPPLSPNCQRPVMFLTPAGRTVQQLKRFVFQVITVQQAIAKCNARRINRLILCAIRHPVTEAPADPQGFHDEQGAAAFNACQARVTGVRLRR
jgi:hypothetical protein